LILTLFLRKGKMSRKLLWKKDQSRLFDEEMIRKGKEVNHVKLEVKMITRRTQSQSWLLL